ncbi:MAG: mobile mystery protein A [Bacteroidia bacterium]
MDTKKQKLIIEQVDRKLALLKPLQNTVVPQGGWITTIRKALKMSLRQLGLRLKVSPQSVKEIEQREADGSITIKTLREAAAGLDMQLVYGVIPKGKTLEGMIEERANQVAREIVLRTSNSMMLEDQKNTDVRIEKAIKSRASEIINTMPKYLWD